MTVGTQVFKIRASRVSFWKGRDFRSRSSFRDSVVVVPVDVVESMSSEFLEDDPFTPFTAIEGSSGGEVDSVEEYNAVEHCFSFR